MILDYIFERKCIFCKKNIKVKQFPGWICKNCLKLFEFIENVYCDRCGTPFMEKCFCNRLSENIVKMRSIFIYDGVGKEAIQKWKYSGVYYMKDIFEKFLKLRYPFKQESIESVTAVPIHFFKKIKRGFNQSEIIAQFIHKEFGLDNCSNFFKRRKYSKPQSFCDNYLQREKNINGCFIVKKNFFSNSILIVDDIFTSGATINEMIKIVKNINPEIKVYVLTLSLALQD